jgi:3-hydroxybutyrate dehydrogenase
MGMELSFECLFWMFTLIGSFCLFPFFPVLFLLWTAFAVWFIYRHFIAIERINCEGKGVYVTGCDSGFGYEVAILLDSHGFHVFAGCLDPAGEGANFLRAQGSDRLTIVDLDITNEQKISQAAQIVSTECEKRGICLWALYNNAGVSTAGEIEWTSMAHFQKLISVNLLGAIAVTKSVLPLIRQSEGRIVSITSGISRMPLLGRAAYCIPKAGLESFMTSLRYEMHKFNVKCSIIYPGNFVGATRVFSGLEQHIDQVYAELDQGVMRDYGREYCQRFREQIIGSYSSASTMSSTPVLKAIFHAITSVHPRARYKPMGFGWMIYDLLMQHLPEELSDQIIRYYDTLPPPSQRCPHRRE